MIIHKINIGDVGTIESKDDPPISLDRDAPVTSEIAFQGMKPPAGQAQMLRLRCASKTFQHACNLIDVLGIQLAPVVILVQPTQASMSEMLNRANIVKCKLSLINSLIA